MPTEKQIFEAINNCIWRKDVGGIYICTGDCCPCEKHIADGMCDTLIRLFMKTQESEEK